MKRFLAVLALVLLAAGTARAGTITVTLATAAGTLSQSSTIADVDANQIVAAYQSTYNASQGNAGPPFTPQLAFSTMVRTLIGEVVAFTQAWEKQQAISALPQPAAIVVTPLATKPLVATPQ